MASGMGAPKWGQRRSQYKPRRGTMPDVLERCLKKTEAQVCTKIIRSVFAKKYSNFLSRNMLIGKPTFKIYIVQYVHGIIANSHCPL
jgi:hypothetical protein